MIVLLHHRHSIFKRKKSLSWAMHNTLRIDARDDLNASNVIKSCTGSKFNYDNLVALKFVL